jgi:hypothetical protein
MGPRLVRIASATVDRLVGQDVARENARTAASALAQGRVNRLEVEHYLEQHVRSRRPHDLSTRRGAAR